jgi:hypothetical protein
MIAKKQTKSRKGKAAKNTRFNFSASGQLAAPDQPSAYMKLADYFTALSKGTPPEPIEGSSFVVAEAK